MHEPRSIDRLHGSGTDIDILVKQSLDLSSEFVEDAWTLPPRAYMSQEFFDLVRNNGH